MVSLKCNGIMSVSLDFLICSSNVYQSNGIRIKGYSQDTDLCNPVKSEDVLCYVYKRLNERLLSLKAGQDERLQAILKDSLSSGFLNVNVEITDWVKDSFSLKLFMDKNQRQASFIGEELNCTFIQDFSSDIKVLKEVNCFDRSSFEKGTLHWEIKTDFDMNVPSLTAFLKVCAGLAGTIFFGSQACQKAYKYFERDRIKVCDLIKVEPVSGTPEQGDSVQKASSWELVAYTVAAFSSAIFTVFSFRDL